MDMDLQEFVGKMAEQFDEADGVAFNAGTEFKALDGWSSLSALSIIAMVDDEYGITLKGDDIRNAETIEDLYKTVESRK
jgi:acyl carrier protein